TKCFVFAQKRFRSKLDGKAKVGHTSIIGYVNDYDNYRVWVSSDNKVVCARMAFVYCVKKSVARRTVVNRKLKLSLPMHHLRVMQRVNRLMMDLKKIPLLVSMWRMRTTHQTSGVARNFVRGG